MVAVLKIAAAIGVTLTELFREVESDQKQAAPPPAIPKGRPRKDQGKQAGAGRAEAKKGDAVQTKRR